MTHLCSLSISLAVCSEQRVKDTEWQFRSLLDESLEQMQGCKAGTCNSNRERKLPADGSVYLASCQQTAEPSHFRDNRQPLGSLTANPCQLTI